MKNKTTAKKLAQLALAGLAVGALSLTACEKTTGSNNDGKDEAALAKFIKDCQDAGNTVEQHECQSMNSCKGEAFQLGVGTSTHDCKGLSSCKGASCITG